MKVRLEPLEEIDIPQRGQTVVYLTGESELLFQTEHGNFQISAGGQVALKNVFTSIRIKNMGSVYTESTINIVEGEFQRLSDVSIVQIDGITNTINANIQSIPAVDVSTMPPVVVSELPTVKVSEMPAVAVSALPPVVVSTLPEVVKKDVSNVVTTVYTVPPESSVNIPALTNRKRLVIQAYSPATEVIFCRVSDSSKASITGQLLVCGGDLLAEVEHLHTAALKVWNPSVLESVEVVTLEEF